MDTALAAKPYWTTAVFGDAIDTSPADLYALGEHLSCCKAARGRMFTLRRAADHMDAFVAGRIVTCMLGAAALLITVVLVVKGW